MKVRDTGDAVKTKNSSFTPSQMSLQLRRGAKQTATHAARFTLVSEVSGSGHRRSAEHELFSTC